MASKYLINFKHIDIPLVLIMIDLVTINYTNKLKIEVLNVTTS